MRWKKYSEEQPRKEHRRVLVRLGNRCPAWGVKCWDSRPIGDSTEWLDHLDDGWIPVSERLPTEEDGKHQYRDSKALYVDVTTVDGSVLRSLWDSDRFTNGTITAWRHLPDPYVPPEKPLWESMDEFDSAKDALPRTFSVSQLHDFQRELRKRGLEIRKVEK